MEYVKLLAFMITACGTPMLAELMTSTLVSLVRLFHIIGHKKRKVMFNKRIWSMESVRRDRARQLYLSWGLEVAS